MMFVIAGFHCTTRKCKYFFAGVELPMTLPITNYDALLLSCTRLTGARPLNQVQVTNFIVLNC